MKFAVAVAGIVLAGGMLVGCGGNAAPFDPCKVNPTYQAEDGNWYEADGERLDDDPCDSDDFDKHGKLKPTVKKPVVTHKPAPMVKQQPPAPRQTVGTNKGSNSTSTRKNTTGSGR